MRTFIVSVVSSLAVIGSVECFSPIGVVSPTVARCSSTALNGYVPDGLTKEQWAKIQKKERETKAGLGNLGPRGFKSRSMQSFQEALERGEAAHQLPMFNAKQKLARGEIKLEDIPYMQRGGSWDNSDVKGAKKLKWLQSDKEYASGGYLKEQSVSIFGNGAGLDWTGTRSRSGPESVQGRQVPFPKNYKAPTVSTVKSEEPKKKFFGLF